MLNRRSTKIKPAKNFSKQKQGHLQNPRTSPKTCYRATLLLRLVQGKKHALFDKLCA